jgi:hypothetical protein
VFYKLEICNSILLHIYFTQIILLNSPVLVAARSKAWVCGHSLDGIAGSNPAREMEFFSLVSVACFQVEVSAMG